MNLVDFVILFILGFVLGAIIYFKVIKKRKRACSKCPYKTTHSNSNCYNCENKK